MTFYAFMGSMEIGLIFALVALGVLISFRILNFPDLSVDGTFPLGGAVAAILISKGSNPFLTQNGKDREEGPDQYVSNLCTDCTVGFKYFDLRDTREITVHLQGYGNGCAVTVRTQEHGEPICRIPVETALQEKAFTGQLPGGLSEKEALYFSVEGNGGTFDFVSFDLK